MKTFLLIVIFLGSGLFGGLVTWYLMGAFGFKGMLLGWCLGAFVGIFMGKLAYKVSKIYE